MKVVVRTRCQRCANAMPDERPDSWCNQCATLVELDQIYGDDEGFDFGCQDDADLTCDRCGGDGSIEYAENPDVWGEDCPSEVDHLVTCPSCHGRGWIPAISEPEKHAA